ncbi:MAG: PKD domain-containing protein [Flavobacteriales bacterium]|nr:PKD domain-containing protein [Flavobacteriales bacterium]
MSTSKTGLDAFERSLKDSLDQFEVPYNSADWTQMERSLNGNSRGWWVSGLGLSVLVAGLVVVGGGTWYALTSARPVPEPLADTASPTVPGLTTEAPTSSVPSKDIVTLMPETKGSTVADQLGSGTVTSQDNSDTGNRANKEARIVSSTADAAETSTKEAPVTEKPATVPTAGANANEITFKASIAEGCPGTSVDFKVSNMPEDGIYLWNFGDGSFSNHANPEHTFTKAGRYQVMLSMSAAGVGTIQNKPSSDVIEIHEAPMAAFNVLKQEYDGHLPSVHFENRSLAGAKYSWDFGDGQTSTIAHPDHVYKKKGVYQVELTVTNETGCEDKVMKDVRIDKDYNLDAPASFSPNGDEFQETFMPEALRTLGVKFNLTVYSANGTLLYQTNDASKPWTGRAQNRGNICGAGDYVWVVDVRESLHLAETYTGKVRLER